MDGQELAHIDGNSIDGLQFCAQVYEVFEAIRTADNGPSRLRMRENKAIKRLLEELLPICNYVQAKYRLGRYISVKWIDGNQQFDAETSQRGARVDNGFEPVAGYLEVTSAMYQNDHLVRELMDKGEPAFGVEGVYRDKKTGAIVSSAHRSHPRSQRSRGLSRIRLRSSSSRSRCSGYSPALSVMRA